MHFLFSAALKDLRRIRNDIWKPVIWAAIPLVIAGLITMAMGGSGGVQPTVQLLVADEDDSFLSNFLTGSFGQGEAGKLFHVEKVFSDKGRQILSEGGASALLIIPKGFGEDVLNDSPCELLLITNPAQRILPGIAEETVSILVDGSFYAHRILGDEIRQLAKGPTDLDNGFSNDEIAKTSVQINKVMQRVTKYINPLAITLESTVDKKKDENEN